ncbi:hypothetical protein [Nonomuraea dietziae]|uniref:hypothetical protein n=1 Tax=Nonomuraea dietziae TaxID=65515 RepID=UPI0031D41D17
MPCIALPAPPSSWPAVKACRRTATTLTAVKILKGVKNLTMWTRIGRAADPGIRHRSSSRLHRRV